MMQNLLYLVAGAVWCLIGLLLVVGITAIIKLKPRPTATAPSPKEIARSVPWEKFRGRDLHSESPGMQKVFETHREPPNVFMSSRWEDVHFVSHVRMQKRGNKRVAEPKHNMRKIPSVRAYSLRKRYDPAGLITTDHV
jgi:hypothetical protein